MSRALLERLVPNVVAAAAAGRKRLRSGPFEVFLSEASDEYLLSFAVPVERCDEWRPAVEALKRLFAEHERTLRLEFFWDLHPGLAPTLVAMGFYRNMEAPVMALTEAGYAAAPPGPARLVAAEDDAAVDAVLLVQREAFKSPLDEAGEAEWRAKMVAGIAAGTLRVALAEANGAAAASAVLMLGAEAAELAGVGTRPGFRRRGLAEAACRTVLDAYFADGHDLAWLSAGIEAEGLYAKLGFRPIGTQLNFGALQRAG